MDLQTFISLCKVWNLEQFWHVFFDSEQSIINNSSVRNIIHSISRANPDCYIRFSSSVGETVWMYNGKSNNPFENNYIMSGKTSFISRNNETSENRTIISSQVDYSSGLQRVEWSSSVLDYDLPSLVSCSTGRTLIWDENEIPRPDVDTHRYGWGPELLSFIPQHSTVTFCFQRKLLWRDGNYFRRASPEKHTEEVNEHVFEHGYINDNGQLVLVRISGAKKFLWGYQLMLGKSPATHRTDGPSEVFLYNVKELYCGNNYSLVRMGPYEHKWSLNGRYLSPSSIQEFCKENNIIPQEGPCYDRPFFLNDQDRMFWLSAFS